MKGGETDMRHTQGKRGREMSMEKGRGTTVRVGQRDVRVLREARCEKKANTVKVTGLAAINWFWKTLVFCPSLVYLLTGTRFKSIQRAEEIDFESVTAGSQLLPCMF